MKVCCIRKVASKAQG